MLKVAVLLFIIGFAVAMDTNRAMNARGAMTADETKKEDRREILNKANEDAQRDQRETKLGQLEAQREEREIKLRGAMTTEEAKRDERNIMTRAVEDGFSWDAIPIVTNATQCIYRPVLRVLACRGPEGIVECPAVLELSRVGDMKIEVFGIRRDRVLSALSPVETTLWPLYPRKLDNTTYWNTTVVVEERPVEIFLYFGEKSIHTGIRVTDAKCYRRVVENIFRPSVENHVVQLETSETIGLFGEVLLTDKQVQHKRFLGFGLPWFGGLGWGFGLGWGLGWGLPFWG